MKKSYLLLVLFLSVTFIENVYGQPEPPAGLKEAVQSCASSLGISVPPKNDSDKSSLDACLAKKGIKAPGGRQQRPLNGDQEKVRACLEKSGIKMPRPQPGQPPQIDEATKSAIMSCMQQVKGAGSSVEDSNGASSAASAQ